MRDIFFAAACVFFRDRGRFPLVFLSFFFIAGVYIVANRRVGLTDVCVLFALGMFTRPLYRREGFILGRYVQCNACEHYSMIKAHAAAAM